MKLGDLGSLLWRRKLYVFLAVALWMLAGLYVNSRPVQYQASTDMQIMPAKVFIPAPRFRAYVAELLAIYGNLTQGQRFAGAVAAKSGVAGTSPDKIIGALSLNPQPTTGRFTVTARWGTRAGAAAIARTAATELTATRLQVEHYPGRPTSSVLVAATQSLDGAAVQVGKVGPTKTVFWVAWALAAAIVGVIAALAADRLFDRVVDVDGIRRAGLPIAGVLPRLPRKLPTGPLKEGDRFTRALEILGTDLLYRLGGLQMESIAIMGLSRKSRGDLVARNLATVIAKTGIDVVLAEANPDAAASSNSAGDGADQEREAEADASTGAMLPGSDPGIAVLPFNDRTPVALLTTLRGLAEEIAGARRVVLVDVEPLQGAGDGRLVAGMVSGVLLVVRAGEVRTGNLAAAAASLDGMPARLVGVVLIGASRSVVRRSVAATAPANHGEPALSTVVSETQ